MFPCVLWPVFEPPSDRSTLTYPYLIRHPAHISIIERQWNTFTSPCQLAVRTPNRSKTIVSRPPGIETRVSPPYPRLPCHRHRPHRPRHLPFLHHRHLLFLRHRHLPFLNPFQSHQLVPTPTSYIRHAITAGTSNPFRSS